MKKLDKKGIFMSKYFKKNNEKSARSHPGYEKMQANSSHQQQQQYQKVLLGHRSGRL